MSITIRAFEAATHYRVADVDASRDANGEATLTPLDIIYDSAGHALPSTAATIADFEAGRIAAAIAPVTAPTARVVPAFDPHNIEHYTYEVSVERARVSRGVRCDVFTECDELSTVLTGANQSGRYFVTGGELQIGVSVLEDDFIEDDLLGEISGIDISHLDPANGPFVRQIVVGDTQVLLTITPRPIEVRRASESMLVSAAGSMPELGRILDDHAAAVATATAAVDGLHPSILYNTSRDHYERTTARYQQARDLILDLPADSMERRALIRRFNEEVRNEEYVYNRGALTISL